MFSAAGTICQLLLLAILTTDYERMYVNIWYEVMSNRMRMWIVALDIQLSISNPVSAIPFWYADCCLIMWLCLLIRLYVSVFKKKNQNNKLIFSKSTLKASFFPLSSNILLYF